MAVQKVSQSQLPSTIVGTKAAFAGSISGASENEYFHPGSVASATGAATQTVAQSARIPYAGTLQSLYLVSDVAAAGTGEKFVLYINGVASALEATILAAATTASNVVDAPAVAAGDKVAVFYDPASDHGVGEVAWGFELRAS